MTDVRILSGGAAHGLVKKVEAAFREKTGLGLTGDFGAVGGMKSRLLDGEITDVVILTSAIMQELGAAGIITRETLADLGPVPTSVAVRTGQPAPDVSSGDTLAAALLAADAIYFPDPELATAGIHFRNVMQRLGVFEAVAQRLRPYPNGATAMRALAAAPEPNPIGCTQATEIVATPGVSLVADLPEGFGLVTIYTAAAHVAAANPEAAAALVRLLAATKIGV